MIPIKNTNKGLIKTVVLVFIVLIILAVLGLNLRGIIDSQTFQDNWNFLKSIFVNVWNWLWNYILGPIFNRAFSNTA